MAGQSPLRGCSTVWSKAKKNYELEWRSLPSTQESAWLCKLLFILTKTPLKQQLLCLPPLTGSFLSMDGSLVRSRFQHHVPHTERMCYGGLVMCEPGGSKTYTIRLPKTGLSQRVFYNKSGAECFFDPCDLSLWRRQVMTDDKRQVQPINAEWRGVRGTLTGSGRVDHVQFGLDLQLSTVLRGTLFKEENIQPGGFKRASRLKLVAFLVSFWEKTQTLKGISWRSVKFPNVVIKTMRLENYQQYNSSAGPLTETNHTQDLHSIQIWCVWWVTTPQQNQNQFSDARFHRTPSGSSRHPDLWHQRWYNTVLIKHKYMSATEKEETWPRMHRSAPSERRLLKMAERAGPCWHQELTLSHSHMEAFFFLQSCSFRFNKSGGDHIHCFWDFIQYVL